jgi:hypothetical protein
MKEGDHAPMTMNRFKGSLTALVTPFKNGALDEEAFRAHVDWQIENGTQGSSRSAPPARARRSRMTSTRRSSPGASRRRAGASR